MASSSPVLITAVDERSDIGVSTKPFVCRGEDNEVYYVKLGNALPQSLIAEWVAGRLAQLMGLPIAEFRLVEVDPALHEMLPSEYKELGFGIGFGSVAAPAGARDLIPAQIPELIRAKSRQTQEYLPELLAFDLWIRNEDRIMGARGGNPNALFVPNVDQPLVIIDHDNAFDPTFDAVSIREKHLASEFIEKCRDPEWQKDWLRRADSALTNLSKIWAEIPPSWLEDDFGFSTQHLPLETINDTLAIPWKPEVDFWEPFARLRP